MICCACRKLLSDLHLLRCSYCGKPVCARCLQAHQRRCEGSVAATLPAQAEITTWSEWPGFSGWRVASLRWSVTGETWPERYWLNFHFREYPLWPTAFAVDQDDAANYAVEVEIVMYRRVDVNGDGPVTTADYSAVKECLGTWPPNPADYGG